MFYAYLKKTRALYGSGGLSSDLIPQATNKIGNRWSSIFTYFKLVVNVIEYKSEILKSPLSFTSVWKKYLLTHCDITLYSFRLWIFQVLNREKPVKEKPVNTKEGFPCLPFSKHSVTFLQSIWSNLRDKSRLEFKEENFDSLFLCLFVVYVSWREEFLLFGLGYPIQYHTYKYWNEWRSFWSFSYISNAEWI